MIHTIPSAGAWGVKCLGIPHQISKYMVLFPNALFNKQYDYINGFYIINIQIDFWELAVVVFFNSKSVILLY